MVSIDPGGLGMISLAIAVVICAIPITLAYYLLSIYPDWNIFWVRVGLPGIFGALIAWLQRIILGYFSKNSQKEE